LSKAYPTLTVKGLCSDFIRPVNILDIPLGDRLIFFPGSTIGNFEPTDAVNFLKQMARLARSGGRLLIGVDLKKDPAVLNAAYNDSEGFTAAFNMNLLARMNNELDANFRISQFKHSAFYNEQSGRVEMHLVSQSEQVVQIDNTHFGFSRNDTIHTENSYKYSIKEFQTLARLGDFEPDKVWTDPDDLFSLHLLNVA
ncbi:MAG TPA: L-histidine N(alpha)-methyltransferase, partial [Gammaproteobacteria bacterium]|nr:L-histidine N(alpha)-methyltransferase [Gammaproteobacteria bacterium]